MRTRPPRATPRVPDLPGEADRSSEEAVQRVHRLAHLEERVEELRARNLVVAKAPTGDEVLAPQVLDERMIRIDRKSTRLNSSHLVISYAVFCLKKKNKYN